ncbi:MAG: FAD-binding and (Fe-S)-binding domain-containing protein [Candidatus Zixiibacteriota bacterium]
MNKKIGPKAASQGWISEPLAIEAYASDGSIYSVQPTEVFCPDSAENAADAIRRSLQLRQSVTPRGGGTGLAGGALGAGLIVDFSRLTQIIEVNTEQQSVHCQPGIIYKDLNLALKEHGLFFPPDPSSGDSCEIGGMLANNSSGPRSVKYGLTSHYVKKLTVMLYTGELLEVEPLELDSEELHEFFVQYPPFGHIFELLYENKSLIQERWPRVRKNSAGYNLKQVADDFDKGIFNIPALFIGSEGTLGPFFDVTLKLLPIPGTPLSFRLFFDSLEAAGAAIEPLLATQPCALEIVDGSTLDLIGRDTYKIPPTAQAMLLLEYDDKYDARKEQLEALAAHINLSRPPELAEDAEQRNDLWAARRAIVPILYRHHATRRPFAFIEDASVPVEKLTEFIGWIRQTLEKENLTFGLFGHIGDGNLHIRPLLDIHTKTDNELMRRLYDEVYVKMISLGGSSTAEHADGRLRAPVLKNIYGEEIYSLFVQIKKYLDPGNMFNPDVILSEKPFTDDIDYHKLELTCAACGKCNGYCPAYEIFRRESMSPRGWLRMLHAANADSDTLIDAYQFCVNCKNCTTVCPAGVDIAGEILDFKAKHPHKNAGRVIALFNNKSLFGALLKTASLTNPIMKSSIGKTLTAAIGGRSMGLDKTAEFPMPAIKTLRDRHKDACERTTGVALFHGCADNYFVSYAGDALIEVYKHFGMNIALPMQDCCGLPMEVYGHRDTMIDKAKHNIDSLMPFDAVVFTCASCQHRIADYADIFSPGSEYHDKAKTLKSKLFDSCQYLIKSGVDFGALTYPGNKVVSYHHPCHLRAAKLEKEPLKLLKSINGITLVHPELAGRCCGQAGSFGFTHYREGTAMFDRKREEYLKLNPDIVVSSCPSCISKVRKELPKTTRVCHPLEIVADCIRGRDTRG